MYITLPESKEFIRLFQEGNQQVFKQVFDATINRLKIFLYGHYVEGSQADDILASVYYTLFKHREKMQNIDHIIRWLHIATKHKMVDEWRAKVKEIQLKKELVYISEDSEEIVIQHNYMQIVREQVDKLPPKQKLIIEKCFYQGKSTFKIADEMGINRQTVINQRTTAINKLMEVLPFAGKRKGKQIIIL